MDVLGCTCTILLGQRTGSKQGTRSRIAYFLTNQSASSKGVYSYCIIARLRAAVCRGLTGITDDHFFISQSFLFIRTDGDE
jgi:hypothetical protein